MGPSDQEQQSSPNEAPSVVQPEVETVTQPTVPQVSDDLQLPPQPVAMPQAQPVVQQPAEFMQTITPQSPVTPGVSLAQKKSRKGLLIGGIAGVVVLGLLVAGAVYAFVYNNPDNAVMDAFTKSLMAKSGSATGTMSMKTQDMSLKMDFSFAANQSNQGSADTTVTVTAGGKDYKMQGHFAGTKDEVYVKLDDLRSLITSAFGSEYTSLIDQYYGSLLNKIDGKWVVIKQSDLDSLSGGSVSNKESQCIQSEVAKLQTDASLRNELSDVYKKNPLFTVQAKGSDSDGNHYFLTPVSDDKAKNFAVAVTETKFFKAIDDCTTSDLKKAFTESTSPSSSSSSSATGGIDLWINGWSHAITKVAMNVKDGSDEFTTEIKINTTTNPSVTIPKADTTIDELKTEIENVQKQLLSAYETSYTDSSQDYSF